MSLYYLSEPALRDRRCAQGEDYTPAYLPAMLAFMGVTGIAIEPDALTTLSADDVLLVGADHSPLPPCTAHLIQFGDRRNAPARLRHVYACYTTREGFSLPLFVPLLGGSDADDVILSTATAEDGTLLPALVRRGKQLRYLFDLPAMLWYSGDGYEQMQQAAYFPFGRTPDHRPLPDGTCCEHPFCDALLIELEGLLRELGIPTLYRLPPMEDGSAPDLVLHFSGDDDCTSAQFNLEASQTMKAAAFPYHINAMPDADGAFVFDNEQRHTLLANGCELGLHLNFLGSSYTLQTVQTQAEQFRRAFGISPVTNVNHCLIQDGRLCEFLRWLQACDIIADNGYLGVFNPDDINAFDLCGFGFGTSFPRYTCDDAAHGNALLSTMSIPLTYYEARLTAEDSDPAKVLGYLDGAAQNARIAQFFFHPHYLTPQSEHAPATARVLRQISEHIAAKGYRALPMTTNTIALFWQKRTAATVVCHGTTYTVTTEVPLLLRLSKDTPTVLLDGVETATQRREVEGGVATLLHVPAGKHEVTQ